MKQTQDCNDLTRVGRGTVMGDFMRRVLGAGGPIERA